MFNTNEAEAESDGLSAESADEKKGSADDANEEINHEMGDRWEHGNWGSVRIRLCVLSFITKHSTMCANMSRTEPICRRCRRY